ncbi:hypothetical protein [Erwinia sp. 9145]|uniref:hypothetical protein n=1 Tax=Erwinia sp. 9145 TaxID=1500895 RepID=UPI000A87110F|nr:hypothetical protein [Erwinia sp. 9145]
MKPTSALATGLVAMEIQEPTSLPVRFQPGWHNVWEASLYKKACRKTLTDGWMFRRFGGDVPLAPRKTELRDSIDAFTDTCERALQTRAAQKRLRQRGAKNAMIFFDSWGETSLFEDIDNWRDSMFVDILPKKILWDFKIQAFSGKLRGERTGFLLALDMAQDCLHSGVADNVVICGQHRHFPVMSLSETERWPRRKPSPQRGTNALFAVERNLCMLVTKCAETLPSLSVGPRQILPTAHRAAAERLSEYWRDAGGEHILSCAPPAPALLDINRRAAAAFAHHVPLYHQYGDSGSLNPALGIYHWFRAEAARTPALISSLHPDQRLWLVNCLPAAALHQDTIDLREKNTSL